MDNSKATTSSKARQLLNSDAVTPKESFCLGVMHMGAWVNEAALGRYAALAFGTPSSQFAHQQL